MEQLLKIAFNELGTEELVGTDDNPEVLKYAKDTGIKGITNDKIPWCNTFINWVAWKAVVALQNALKLLNINVGTSDGDFGSKTAEGIKELQTRKPNLEINGIYNAETRDLMESLFQA